MEKTLNLYKHAHRLLKAKGTCRIYHSNNILSCKQCPLKEYGERHECTTTKAHSWAANFLKIFDTWKNL